MEYLVGRIAVTGATGFVGRHLVDAILDQGHAVTALGRRDPGIPGVAFRRTKDLREMTDPDDWLAPLSGIDRVVHLAALAHRLAPTLPAEEFMRINAGATAALAEAARSAGVQRLIFVSSIGAVATASNELITPETVCAPVSDYGRSKRAAELDIERILGSDSETDYSILRPHLVYGPGNPGNMARLLKVLEKGLPLPLASISNQRSFLYVGNLCSLILLALTEQGVSRRTLPLADIAPLSTPAFLREIGAATGQPVRLFPCPMPLLRSGGSLLDGMLGLAGKVPMAMPAFKQLTGSLATDMTQTLEAFGHPSLIGSEEGIRRSFGDRG